MIWCPAAVIGSGVFNLGSMEKEKTEKLKKGDEIFYAGSFYKVADLKEYPHGLMIGIYDEPGTRHIDYLRPDSVRYVSPCYACQGGGCPVCGGYGKIVN